MISITSDKMVPETSIGFVIKDGTDPVSDITDLINRQHQLHSDAARYCITFVAKITDEILQAISNASVSKYSRIKFCPTECRLHDVGVSVISCKLLIATRLNHLSIQEFTAVIGWFKRIENFAIMPYPNNSNFGLEHVKICQSLHPDIIVKGNGYFTLNWLRDNTKRVRSITHMLVMSEMFWHETDEFATRIAQVLWKL